MSLSRRGRGIPVIGRQLPQEPRDSCSVKSKNIAQWRLHSLRVRGTPSNDPLEVVRHLAALQAQEFPYAKWSVAQRTKDVDDATVQRLLDEGAILRTHLLRPTWHFVLPEDIGWLLELSAPRVHALNAYMYRQLDVGDNVLAKSNSLLAKNLAGANHLTRKEIGVLLHRAGIDASGLRLGYLLMRAELDGLICSGAMRGRQHTYALLDERAPNTKSFDRDGSLLELTRRYFASRGPATVKDYSRWSSLTVADCKRGIDMAGSELEHAVIGGRTYWFAPNASMRFRSGVIDLVQGYDECLMSYSESRDVLVGSAPAQAAALMHAVLLDGQLIGHWKRTEKKDAVEIETSMYRSLSGVEREALQRSAERYGRFLGRRSILP